jgi:hypothetical protein
MALLRRHSRRCGAGVLADIAMAPLSCLRHH